MTPRISKEAVRRLCDDYDDVALATMYLSAEAQVAVVRMQLHRCRDDFHAKVKARLSGYGTNALIEELRQRGDLGLAARAENSQPGSGA